MIRLSRNKDISSFTSVLLVLLQIITLLSMGASPARAGLSFGPEVNLTPDGFQRASHENPAIFENKIVWEDNRNGNLDIYMKDLTSGAETQVTSNATSQSQPTIYGNRVAWVDIRNGNRDIYIKDLVTGIETAAVSNSSEQVRPRLFGDRLVWEEYAAGQLWGESEVYVKNLASGETTSMPGLALATSIDIWGDRVVWNNLSTGIWARDLFTGFDDHIMISNGSSYMVPAVYGDNVVWDQVEDPAGIHLKSVASGTDTIVSAGADKYTPDIYDDTVVWMDTGAGYGQIFMKNLTTGIESAVATSAEEQSRPQIWGNVVVWQDERNGTFDIYMKNLSTGDVSQVNGDETFAPADQFAGDIDGDKVVWADNRADAPGLYYKHLTDSTGTLFHATPTPPSGTQQWNPRIAGNRVVWADTVSDPFGIYMKDLSTSAETSISAGTMQFNPAISGSKIVWENASTGWSDESIFLKDLEGAGAEAISAGTGQYNPDISGDHVVWSSYVDYDGWRIFLKDLLTGVIEQFSTSDYWEYDHQPAIDGNNVVWLRHGKVHHKNIVSGQEKVLGGAGQASDPVVSGNFVAWSQGWDESDIYVVDLTTGVKTAVTTAPGVQSDPRISGNNIIWTDYRNGNADIYTRSLAENAEPTISGAVDSAAGGLLANVPVKGLPVDSAGNPDLGRPELNAVTDADGYYLFNNPAPGNYKIRFDPPPGGDYARIFYDQAVTTETATLVNAVTGVDLNGIDGTLFQGNSVYGRVTDEIGTPLEGISIDVYKWGGTNWQYVDWGMTGDDGRYSVSGLPAGDYRVGFMDWSNRYVSKYYNNSLSLDGGDDVTVVDGEATIGIDAELDTLMIDSYEPDNSSAEPKPIEIDAPQTHTIMPAGDQDWVSFEATAGVRYELKTFDVSSDLSTRVYVSNGTTVLGNGWGTYWWTAPASGTYFAKVRGYSWQVGRYNLQIGPDAGPPRVVDTHPRDGAGNIGVSQTPHAVMSEPIDPASATNDNAYIQVAGTSETLPATIYAYSESINIDPNENLVTDTSYTVTVKGITDVAGNAMTAPHSWTFKTLDTIPPTTSATVSPDLPDGDNGWYVTTPTVEFLANEPGTSCYQWETTGTGYDYQRQSPQWLGGGTPLDINGGNVGAWYTLPFEFPFYDEAYGQVYLSSNGLMSFESADTAYSNTEVKLQNRVAIAGLWDDLKTGMAVGGNIFASQPDTDTVVFRWQAVTAPFEFDTNFEVVLSRNGNIRFNYGSQAGGLTPTIGISNGDRVNYHIAYDRDLSTTNNMDSIVYTPGGSGWSTYNNPIPVPQGSHTLNYYSADLRKNKEAFQSRSFKVDTESPTNPTMGSPSHSVGVPSIDKNITLDLVGATDSVSGVEGYAVSLTKTATETPAEAVNLLADGDGTETTSSAELVDGAWYWNVRTKDNAGNWSDPIHLGPFIVNAETPVTSPIEPNGDNGWFSAEPTATLSPDEAATTYWQWNSTSPDGWETGPLSGFEEGQHTLYFFSVDENNNTETVKQQQFWLDLGDPEDPDAASPGDPIGVWRADNDLHIDLSDATDLVSGLDGYSYSWRQNATETPDHVLDLQEDAVAVDGNGLGDGIWWFNLSTKDIAGHWTSTLHYGPFLVDTGKPTGAIAINSGAAETNSTAAILTLMANDGAGSGAVQMRFSNDGANWSAPEPVGPSKGWTLTAGDGVKTVYVQYYDAVGNLSEPIADSIVLKTVTPPAPQVPVATKLTLLAKPRTVTLGQASRLRGRLTDTSGIGLAGKRIKIKAGTKVLKIVTTGLDGTYRLRVRPKRKTVYRAVFPGDAGAVATRSRVKTVYVTL